VFATAFRSVARPSTALGWNLCGAVLGGAIEASSMWLGIKWLSVAAGLLYAASWLAYAFAEREARAAAADANTQLPDATPEAVS